MLFELLVNELDPKTVCETLGLCPVPQRASPVVPALAMEPARMVGIGYVKNDALCTLCTYLVQTVDDFLKDNKTEVSGISYFTSKYLS